MTITQARSILRLIEEHDLKDFLELGFAHGVGTCYLASMVKGLGSGTLTSIDLVEALDRVPNVNELLRKCGLQKIPKLYFEPSSYTWRLMKVLEENPEPCFDFCYLDAAHTWAVDALGFFLVDRLLRVGGWIIFDDINWTLGSSPTIGQSDWVQALPEDERQIPQIERVYELLVKPHPNYGEFRLEGNWAYARKVCDGDAAELTIRTERVLETPSQFLLRVSKALRRRVRGRLN